MRLFLIACLLLACPLSQAAIKPLYGSIPKITKPITCCKHYRYNIDNGGYPEIKGSSQPWPKMKQGQSIWFPRMRVK